MHGLKLIQYQLGMTRRQPQAQEEKEQEKEEEDRRVTSPLVGLVNDDFCVAEVTVGPHWICKYSWKSCCADQETTLPSLFDEAIFANSKLWDEPLPSYNELTWLGFYTRPRAPMHWRCPRRPARLEFIYVYNIHTWYICRPLHNLWTLSILAHESSKATPAMTVDSTGEAAPVRRSYSMAGWTGRKPKEAREKTCGFVGRRNVWITCVSLMDRPCFCL